LRKRLVLFGLGAVALLVGLTGYAANTAEWVNVLAHVEKEIEMACVVQDDGDWLATPAEIFDDPKVPSSAAGDCNFGRVFPETTERMVVELTLSQSFLDNYTRTDRPDNPAFTGVVYNILWECKLVDEFSAHGTQIPPPSTIEVNQCRDELLPQHINNPLWLDDNIRDHITVGLTNNSNANCKKVPGGNLFSPPAQNPAEVEVVDAAYRGNLSTESAGIKCFFELRLLVPACNGHWNVHTDPLPNPVGVDCRDNLSTVGRDPQDWEHWANLGDNFKIQVIGFLTD
jgi:hypothetical protein